MARVKTGFTARRRRKKFLKLAEGYYSSGSRCYIHARERVERALAYAYRDRKVRKRDFRVLWITRINAAARSLGWSYGTLMHALKKDGIELNRKQLAEMAVRDFPGFTHMVSQLSKAQARA